MSAFKEIYRNTFELPLLEEIDSCAEIKHFEVGDVIMNPGQSVRFIPLLLNGTIKVSRINENKEALLYYISKGETCSMTFTCCMQRKQSEVLATCEEACDLLIIPLEKMDPWMHQYTTWKSFVMNSIQTKFDELFQVIDQIAFSKLDERLLTYLQSESDRINSKSIPLSHSQIAKDLSSSRVVISRLLKKMEQDELLKLNRNSIDLLDL